MGKTDFMDIIDNLKSLRDHIAQLRKNGKPIALVPTMGALHAGHISLVIAAQKYTPNVIVSIFVNPTQFGAGEDWDSYPRQLADDAALLDKHDVPIIWAPTPDIIYPQGFATQMSISGWDENLCGARRPGHFNGVILIVSKLFNQSDADLAFFGEKDYQQLAIIRQMARDLDFNIEIIGVPTMRNADGLALSSRNSYLTDEELTKALALPKALQKAASAIQKGDNVETTLKNATQYLRQSGFQSVDYFELVDAQSLKPLAQWNEQPARLLAAAFIGKTRLIDNLSIK